MRPTPALFALLPPIVLGLAACKADPAPPAPAPTPTSQVAPAPRTLVSSDFDPASLGARIVGPKGPQVESEFADDGTFAKIVSYVACPEGVDPCDPATLPADTKYTYVHEVTLAEAEPSAATPAPSATPATPQPLLFSTRRPVTGFAGAIGYSREQAAAALGPDNDIQTQVDADRLVWRVTKGQAWKPGTTITFWWQSKYAPEGPARAYRLEADGKSGDATGPFPPATPPEPTSTPTGETPR